MKVLWICNLVPTFICRRFGMKVNFSGGWLDHMLQMLIADNHSVCVLCRARKSEDMSDRNLSLLTFTQSNYKDVIQNRINAFQPDIVHIWGTEYEHTKAAASYCKRYNVRFVVSIQGLISVYGKYHYAEGLPQRIVNRYTLHDFIRQDNIRQGREKYIARGKDEIEAIRMTSYVIGRTDWDYALTKQINPKIRYFKCNESLRNAFYNTEWSILSIERGSIFLSQSYNPIKGFHFMLEAMPEILLNSPNAHVYTTGKNLLTLSTRDRIRITSYERYLIELIDRYRLQGHISFLGSLNEEEMRDRYLKSNVFVSASTIENSPNSLGEAMLLGCPCVASDVGGVKNMMSDGEGFVYQSTASYMIAHYVSEILNHDELAIRFSKASREHALKTHDREKNYNDLLNIYHTIMKEDLAR